VALETENRSTPALGFAGPADAEPAPNVWQSCWQPPGLSVPGPRHVLSPAQHMSPVRASSHGHLSFTAEPARPGVRASPPRLEGFPLPQPHEASFGQGLSIQLCRAMRVLLRGREGAKVGLSHRAFPGQGAMATRRPVSGGRMEFFLKCAPIWTQHVGDVCDTAG